MSWQEKANCKGVDPNIFHPETKGQGAREAKAYCMGCTVVEECLTYAVKNNIQLGIWGGLNGNERRPYRRLYVQTGRITLSDTIDQVG